MYSCIPLSFPVSQREFDNANLCKDCVTWCVENSLETNVSPSVVIVSLLYLVTPDLNGAHYRVYHLCGIRSHSPFSAILMKCI